MAAGGTIKVTAYMAGRWVKAVFLVILGIVLLLYSGDLVEEMRTNVVIMTDGDVIAFEFTWDLLSILLWILVAWLFVVAAITVAVSFEQGKYTMVDVVKRLDGIEKKLGIKKPKVEIDEEGEEEEEEEERKEPEVEVVFDRPRPPVEEEVPPPPAPPPPGE